MQHKIALLTLAVILLPGAAAHAQYQRQINLGGGFVLNTKTYQDAQLKNWQPALPAKKAATPQPYATLGLRPLPAKPAQPQAKPQQAPVRPADVLAQHTKKQVLQALTPAQARIQKGQTKQALTRRPATLSEVSKFAQENAATFKNIVKKRNLNESLSDNEVRVWIQFENMRAELAHKAPMSYKEMGIARAKLKRAGISTREIDGKTRAAFEKEANRRMQENQQIHDYNVTVNPVLD